jgi:hypothetical protein
MGRRFFLLGSLLLVATVALWIADAANVIPSSTDDNWSGLTLKAGMVALAAALLLRVLAPVSGFMAKGRCTVCGRLTERGHTYCLDHLQETVNSMRDGRSQGSSAPRPRPRPHP